jgi:hypothetical protein
MIGAQPQWYAQTRRAEEGCSQVRGSRRLMLKQRSPSRPTQKSSPMTGDSNVEDGNSDATYKPSVLSSIRGKKWRPRSMTPEHPPKVPRHQKELSTPIQRYHGQLSGGLAISVSTPASRLLSPTPRFPSLSVPPCPIVPRVIGTASHPVDLEQPTIEPEQPPIDLDQYQCLFTKGKDKVKVALDVALAKFQDAAESF